MSKTWQLLKKEHRRLRLWWCLWWLLVLSDAVLRFTQAAYVGDHGLEASMRLYEQAFPWLAMGLSLLIIGLCHLEESPVSKPSFGQGLPLSPLRLFLVKTGLLLGHLVLLPALVEWIVCLGEGFGAYSSGLVLDWVVDRLPILCACLAIAAIAGNMGVYVALMVLAKGATLLLPSIGRSWTFSSGLAWFPWHRTLVVVVVVMLAIAYHQYRTRRQLRSLVVILLVLLALGNGQRFLVYGFPTDILSARTKAYPSFGKVTVADRELARRPVLRPDPALEINPSPWQETNRRVERWLLSEGIVPVMASSPANVMAIGLGNMGSTPRPSVAQAELIHEIPLRVGSSVQEGWRLRRIEEVAVGREIEVELLERQALAERYPVQELLPARPSEKVDYVLLNRSLGIGDTFASVSSDDRLDRKAFERRGLPPDWRERRFGNRQWTLQTRALGDVDDLTLAIIRWQPVDVSLDRVVLDGRIHTPPRRSMIDDEEPLLLEWPDKTDRSAVFTYLDKLLRHTGRGGTWAPMQEARIRAFTGVGRTNLDLLLEAVLSIPGETNRKREILSAVGRLATDEDRDFVCSMLCSNIDVLPIILDRGWQDHAQEIILEAAVANPYTMGAPWVEYLLGVDDPRAEDSVWKRVVLGDWSPHLYDLVVDAGIDLSDRIEQQWQAAKLVGDDRGLLIALRSGYPGVLRRIAEFREDQYLWDKVRRKVLPLMRERSPFDGENEDFLPWLKERHLFLTFDEGEQAYVFNGGLQ